MAMQRHIYGQENFNSSKTVLKKRKILKKKIKIEIFTKNKEFNHLHRQLTLTRKYTLKLLKKKSVNILTTNNSK